MALQMTWQNIQRRKSPPLGLKNLGNTCYLNSVLQCLTYTPPLANFCLKNQHSSICESLNLNRKHDCPFCLIERRIVRSLSTDIPQEAPSKIQNSLQIFAKHFRVGRQEDAHEFLRYVIDACHNTCLKQLKARNQGLHQIGHGKGVAGKAEADTIVKEIFGGVLKSQVKCLSCGMESNKMDDIMDISLDLFQSSSLKDALRRFFQSEVLDGNNKYNCEKCKKLSPAKKQMFILRAPNVLVIQLKRFEGIHGLKIDRSIAFEEFLVLSSYMCKASQDSRPEYSLFGSIVHSGYSPESGHYYAYIKDAAGRWYCCNDSHVSPVTPQEVLSEKVYILFFIRANQRPRPTKTSFASNGLKSNGCNGNDTSINQKVTKSSGPPVAARPYGAHNSEKDTPTISKNGSVPLKPKIQFNISNTAAPEVKRGDANGNGTSIEKHGDSNESTVKKEEMSSTSSCNGVAGDKPSDSVKIETQQSLLLLDNGNGKDVEKVGSVLKKLEVFKGNEIGNVSVDGGSVSSHVFKDENHQHHSAISGFKRKSGEIDSGDNCGTGAYEPHRLDRHNYWGEGKEFSLELEKFKEVIAKEAISYLRSCGWYYEVYDSMKSRKRSCIKVEGNSPDKVELKKVLIARSKEKFNPLLPEPLKEKLIGRIRSFYQGNK